MQFIGVHCGAIPDTLLESELFGHEKGAFTGAVRQKLGKFELAHGGTIFLDEIGTITPAAQIKLLQVLQDGTFQRVGGEQLIETDCRIIAASNADLSAMVAKELFRRDLYYRLNVFPIRIPSLRDRREDIPQLTEIFLKRMNRFSHRGIHYVHPAVMEAFQRYPWPGNIRELENLVERACILETSSILTPTSFPAELFADALHASPMPVETGLTLANVRGRAVEEAEKRYLREVLSRNGGKINRTAETAGVTVRQINKLMRKYGIAKEEFR
jgi:transcriptional regulator with GAF, ATPase, and Fis domain